MFFSGHCCIQTVVLTIIDSNGNFDECSFIVSDQPATIAQYPSSSSSSLSTITDKQTTTTTNKQTTATIEKQTTVAETSSYQYATTTKEEKVVGSNKEVSNVLINIVLLYSYKIKTPFYYTKNVNISYLQQLKQNLPYKRKLCHRFS